MMLDKVILWCIKRLVRLWDRRDDKSIFSFENGERKGYAVIVERFYDDYYTCGTGMFPYNRPKEKT